MDEVWFPVFRSRLPAADSTTRVTRSAGCLALLAVAAAYCGGSPTKPTPPPPPTLTLTCPDDISATSPDGNPLPVEFAPQVSGGQAPVTIGCTPESGSPFDIGTTAVSCTATDSAAQNATCQFSVQVAKPPRLKYTRFMAFGDSITEGSTVSPPAAFPMDVNPPTSYPYKLQKLLAARYTAQDITVANAGRAGERAEDAQGRFDEELKTYAPEVVILMEGTNDLNYFLYPCGTAIEPTAFAMEDMTKAALFAGSRAVLVATIPPMRPDGPKARCPDSVIPYNDLVVQLTTRKGASIVDVYSALNRSLFTLIGIDGIHPTDAGYDTIAQTCFDAIVKLFDREPAELPLGGASR
jgi:lysophospholipase L1-like esterase